MATRYFAGNSLAGFVRSSAAVVESTGVGFDSTYVANSISVGLSAADYAESAPFSATGTVWSHFEMDVNHTSSTGTGPTWLNGSTGVFRLLRSSAYVFQPQYWNGSAWTDTGTTFTLSATRYQIDVKIVLGSSFEVYVNKVTLASSGSGWSGGGSTITSLRLHPESASNGGTYYSQVMIADYDMRESKLASRTINGNGTYTDGTGAYTDVDEAVLDESDAVTLASVGNKKGFTKASYTVPIGYVIGAFVGNVRGRVGGGTVTAGKIGCYSAASVNLSADKAFDVIYSPRCHIVSLDPATSTSWTQSGFNSAELYIQAA